MQRLVSKLWSILFFYFCISSSLLAQIVLNEFMIDPDNDNTGEFIEIYNGGDTVLDLTTFYICDEQDTDLVIAFPDTFLYPGHYGLILDPDYAGDYQTLIPDSIPLFSISDSRFGMYGISNSSSKAFSLISTTGSIADTYTTGYPFWPDPGFTIERQYYSGNEWNMSLCSGGTPGTKNSTAIKDHDLDISGVYCDFYNGSLDLSFTINNTGLQDIHTFTYGYIVGMPANAFFPSDTFIKVSSATIPSQDSTRIEMNYVPKFRGVVSIVVHAAINETTHDSLKTNYFIPLEENEIIITEFVASTGDRFSSEYIELLSFSRYPLSLSGLEIHDLTGHTFVDSNYVLSPDSMLVLAQSASFHDDFPFTNNYIIPPAWRSLNNDEDIIRLQNPSGSVVCNLCYDPAWDTRPDCAMQLVDTALDYRDPLNWESSQFGSPGNANTTQKALRHLSFIYDRSFFTPRDTLTFQLVNDGYFPLDECVLVFSGPITDQNIYISPSMPGDTIVCRVDTSGFFYPGTHTCVLSCDPFFSSVIKYYYPYPETPSYFSEILFDPIDTYAQVEFIELENRITPLDMDHWQIVVNNHNLMLNVLFQNTFSVLCSQNKPLRGYSSSSVFPINAFPSLPNAGAEFLLLDPMGRSMDYVDLRDHPKIKEGRSLEKQFNSISSNDRNLWSASVSAQGMTPGNMNSITALPGYHNSFYIYPECFDPSTDDKIQFSIDSDSPLEFCEIYCFNMSGQIVYRFEQALFSNPALIHYWNGRMQNGIIPSRGLYLATAVLHHINGEITKLVTTFIIK